MRRLFLATVYSIGGRIRLAGIGIFRLGFRMESYAWDKQ